MCTHKKLIMIPYANLDDANTGVNIVNKKDRYDIYMKNCCVSLVSAKCHNDCDVALVTNTVVAEKYRILLEENNIKIIQFPFDHFLFEHNYTWALAFYKLCALYHAVTELDYDFYCYMDTDVYIQAPLDHVWDECCENIMLYDINHGLQVRDYNSILAEFESFLGKRVLATHYGGEFFAASRENAKLFIKECSDIYESMIKNNFQTTKGDEFILSIAAYRLRYIVKNAGAYIFRFWTGSFRLVSTAYKYNPVAILHVPNEKENGIIRLYDRYIGRGKLPPQDKVWRMLHLKRMSLSTTCKSLARKIARS